MYIPRYIHCIERVFINETEFRRSHIIRCINKYTRSLRRFVTGLFQTVQMKQDGDADNDVFVNIVVPWYFTMDISQRVLIIALYYEYSRSFKKINVLWESRYNRMHTACLCDFYI